MLRTGTLLLLLMLSAALPCAAQEVAPSPAGVYDVSGWNPGLDDGPPSYAGIATIWANGDAYLFEANMDGQRYTGVGIFDARDDVLALQFNGTDGSGLTLLKRDGDVLSGSWIFSDSPSRSGRERWIRRD